MDFRVVITRPATPVGNKGYRKQAIGIFLVDANGREDDFPSKVEVLLGDKQADYQPGEYTIHPSSFVVKANEFGGNELTCSRLVLVPRVATLKKAI